jgi:murein DD-endopeptidase MepM/ murein hydrolase activator NlpD
MKKLILIAISLALLWGALELTLTVDSAGGVYRGVKLPYFGGQARTITNDGNGHGAGRHALDIGMIYEGVLAIRNGRVIATTVDWGGGNTLILDHGDGYCSLYMHLSEFYVSAGQSVTQGQRIARSGNTGNKTTGPHLHLAVVRGCAGVDNEVAIIFNEAGGRELTHGNRVVSQNGTPMQPYYPSVTNVSNTSVELWWNDYSFNEQGFGIELRYGRGNWEQVLTVAPETIHATIKNLKPSTPYCFRVRAYNEAGSSPYSNATCATTTKQPVVSALPNNRPTQSNNNESTKPLPPSGTLTPQQAAAVQASANGKEDKPISNPAVAPVKPATTPAAATATQPIAPTPEPLPPDVSAALNQWWQTLRGYWIGD